MRHPFPRPAFSRLRAVALALLLAPAGAVAALAQAPAIQPRSIDDCERIKGDLAYNQCLSLFGPAAHSRPASAASSSASSAASEAAPDRATRAAEAEPERGYSRRGRRRGGYRHRGRQRASFAIRRGARSYGHRGHRRRR